MAIKVSVVIPSFNGRELLSKNLPFVLAACSAWNKKGWEVIVVDDASNDGTCNFLRKTYPQIKFVIHLENKRFAVACNSGVKAAKGDIIVLLNNDVVPHEDFLEPLVDLFADNKVFAVGCREKDQKGKNSILSGVGVMAFKRGLVIHWRGQDQDALETSWVTGGSGAFDRRKWLEIGGMDPLFRPAYEEDRDLSYRAKKHGWKILFEPKSIVDHHHETTNKIVFGNEMINVISFKNQFLFVWKNITDFSFLLQHFLWLSYHLSVTNLRTRGLLMKGFFLALKQLPEALKSRKKVKRLFILPDKEIL